MHYLFFTLLMMAFVFWLSHVDLKNIIIVFLTISFSFFRICYSDSIGVQEDQYPPNIAVKVNQSYCHVPVSFHSWTQQSICQTQITVLWIAALILFFNDHFSGSEQFHFFICLCLWVQGYYPSNKPGVEPRRPCRPINITSWLHLSNASNRVTITWGNFGKVSPTAMLHQYEHHSSGDRSFVFFKFKLFSRKCKISKLHWFFVNELCCFAALRRKCSTNLSVKNVIRSKFLKWMFEE